MTAVTDATLIIETLIGRTLTAQQLQNIGINFAKRNIYNFWAPVDPENPTNEEYAQHFLDVLLQFGKETVRVGAEQDASQTAQTTISAAGDSAVADIT